MPLDLSSIEASGEQFVISAAKTAAAKIRPSFFTDDTQVAADVLITSAVTFAGAVLTAYLNRSKVGAAVESAVNAAAPAAAAAGI